ncbi:MAG TPA: phosphatidylcholine synthase [Candidatus Hydrogenedentes bacterium]|nr:phosphatidylcholine synthase [Candidatus Hydrogenedentota bacterium]HNT87858.1 phosphatidylcholine synthase [Candidatus Hydrogenedentota bacterium]
MRKCAAWGVHLFTALGAVAGLMALVATTAHEWRAALLWMGATILVDSLDGTLARVVKVKAVLPGFDGALLDNIVDYFTYVIVPAYFLYEAPIVPGRFALFAAGAITLASAYQFCQADAKTPDHFFRGFPSYWNVVVFYLFLLQWPEWLNLAVILVLALGVFVPVKYLYPSRTRTLRSLTWLLSAVWIVIVSWIVLHYDAETRNGGMRTPLYLSFGYVLYYVALSLYLNLRGGDRLDAGATEDEEDLGSID